MPTMIVRDAKTDDAEVVAELIQLLAASEDDVSPITVDYVAAYLDTDGCHALLAERDGRAVGLLTYSFHLNLFHAATSGAVDMVIVRPEARGAGVGDALVAEALRRFAAAGCAEASVSTGLDNEPAKALYRKHGLTEEALLLEKHFS